MRSFYQNTLSCVTNGEFYFSNILKSDLNFLSRCWVEKVNKISIDFALNLWNIFNHLRLFLSIMFWLILDLWINVVFVCPFSSIMVLVHKIIHSYGNTWKIMLNKLQKYFMEFVWTIVTAHQFMLRSTFWTLPGKFGLICTSLQSYSQVIVYRYTFGGILNIIHFKIAFYLAPQTFKLKVMKSQNE